MIAIKCGLLIDGRGGEPLPDAVLLVTDGKLTGVGPAAQVPIPAGAEVLDATGNTVMPGLFDCHDHISLVTMSIEKRLFTPKTVSIFQTAEMMKRTLEAGFTTIRDPGTLGDVGFRQAVELGLVAGPRLVISGSLGQTGGHLDQFYPAGVELPHYATEMCDGLPAVIRTVRQVLRTGVDFIKVCTTGGVASPADDPEYTEWTMEELEAIVYEASARKRAVMAHAEGNQGIKNAIRAGAWTVEHGSFLDDEAIQMFLDTGTYLVPTLTIVEAIIERGRDMGLSEVSLAKIEKVWKVHNDSFAKAVAAGVKIAAGTDNISEEMHGDNARELELMVRYGMTPMQAIVAATKTSAEACRIDDRVGTLETGKLADLLVVDGNPTDDISILRDKSRILLVMKEGKIAADRR